MWGKIFKERKLNCYVLLKFIKLLSVLKLLSLFNSFKCCTNVITSFICFNKRPND